MKAITRKLVQEAGSNHTQLLRVENQEGCKVATGHVACQDQGLPVHRSRQYYLCQNPVHTTERFGIKVTPDEAEHNVQQAMKLAQFLCKEADHNIPLQAFLLPPGHPLLTNELKAIVARVGKAKQRNTSQLQGHRSAAKQKFAANVVVESIEYDQFEDWDQDDGNHGVLTTGKTQKEPWDQLHKRMWKAKLNIDWDPSMAAVVPLHYKGCLPVEDIKPPARVQINFFDHLPATSRGELR